MSALLFFHMHGVCSRVAVDATAFAARRDQWDVDILTQWSDPSEADQQMSMARAFWDAISPYSTGVYVNHLDADDAGARVRAAFGNNYTRLADVKRRYDPDNVFRHNSNIQPAE